MPLPDLKPGLIVRYDYLWSQEAAAGRDQGKDRPTCLVAAIDNLAKPRYVVLLPITHSPPGSDTVGIEIPAKAGSRSRRRAELGHRFRIQHRRMAERWPLAIAGAAECVQLWLHSAWPVRANQGQVSRACATEQRPRCAPLIRILKRPAGRKRPRTRPAPVESQKSRAQAQMQGSNPAGHP